MGKFIVPTLIGFLLGMSGGGFFSVWQASSQHATAVADAKKNGLKPDSTAKHDSTGADSASHGEAAAAHDTTSDHDAAAAKPAADTAHAAETRAAAPTPGAAGKAPGDAVAAATTPTGPTAAETAAHQRRLAKIFATMSAKDAARVLGQMSDNDVSRILNQLGDKQAAAILTNLPAPRAAVLSQMQPPRGGGGE